MADPFIGEIKIFPYTYAPRGWALCNGNMLERNQLPVLFSIIETIYGGDGVRYFQLPDFRGRTPMNRGQTETKTYKIGYSSGTDSIVLDEFQTPRHSHRLLATTDIADKKTMDNPSMLAKTELKRGSGIDVYANVTENPTKIQMHSNSLSAVGEYAAHENRQPSLTFNFCIALKGLYPSRE